MTRTHSARCRPDVEPRFLQLLVQLPVPSSHHALCAPAAQRVSPFLSLSTCSGRILGLEGFPPEAESGHNLRPLLELSTRLSAALEAGNQVRVATCTWRLSPRGRAGQNQPLCLRWSVTGLAPQRRGHALPAGLSHREVSIEGGRSWKDLGEAPGRPVWFQTGQLGPGEGQWLAQIHTVMTSVVTCGAQFFQLLIDSKKKINK